MVHPSSQPGADAPGGSLRATFGGLLNELPGLISDRVELLSLELQRAGLALLHITCLGLALTVLALTGWMLLWGLATAALVAAGLHWAGALFAALLVHGLLGWWVVRRIHRLLPTLGLPATRRQLMFKATPPSTGAQNENNATPSVAP